MLNETATVEETPNFVVQDLNIDRTPEEVEAIYLPYGKFTKRQR